NEENAKLFGKCNSPNYHGHNYTLEVTISGTPDPKTGYVMDFGELDRIVDANCVALLDHKNLALDVAFLKGTLSAADNDWVGCWKRRGGMLGAGGTRAEVARGETLAPQALGNGEQLCRIRRGVTARVSPRWPNCARTARSRRASATSSAVNCRISFAGSWS